MTDGYYVVGFDRLLHLSCFYIIIHVAYALAKCILVLCIRL